MPTKKSGGRLHKASSKEKISASLKAFHSSRRALLYAALKTIKESEREDCCARD